MRSMSALFAPPPDNADDRAPNRAQENAFGGHVHHPHPPPPHHGRIFESFDDGAEVGFDLGSSGPSRSTGSSNMRGMGIGRAAGAAARRIFHERTNTLRSLAHRSSRNRAGLHNTGDFIVSSAIFSVP